MSLTYDNAAVWWFVFFSFHPFLVKCCVAYISVFLDILCSSTWYKIFVSEKQLGEKCRFSECPDEASSFKAGHLTVM